MLTFPIKEQSVTDAQELQYLHKSASTHQGGTAGDNGPYKTSCIAK